MRADINAKYALYLKNVDKKVAQGYIIEKMDKQLFELAYNTEKKLAQKMGDTKKSIMREVIRQSTVFSVQTQRSIKAQFRKAKKAPPDFEKITRQEVWDVLMEIHADKDEDEIYSAVRAAYNQAVLSAAEKHAIEERRIERQAKKAAQA